MLKKLWVLILFVFILICPTMARAEEDSQEACILTLFDTHGAVILVVDPESGSILYANNAAAKFYGYTKEYLETISITQINMPSGEEPMQMQAQPEQNRDYVVFKHRLANNQIRTVELFAYPFEYEGQQVLFTIVHDITDKVLLEEKESAFIAVAITTGSMIIFILLILIVLLLKNDRQLKASKRELENSYQRIKTFLDADHRITYLKDENLKYVFVNKAFEAFFQKKAAEVMGLDDFALTVEEFAHKRRKNDLAVIDKQTQVIGEVEWEGRIYKTTKFPVEMLNGKLGLGAYIEDITEARTHELRRKKTHYRYKILMDALTLNFKDRHDHFDFVLHEALKLTESQYGYIYMYDEDTKEFMLNSWTKGVMDECSVVNKMTKYALDKTGIWGEVVRQRRPIIVNDFQMPHALKKGYPAGHVKLKRFMSVPVFIDERIVAVIGLANKQSEYDDNDMYETIMLMNGTWQAAERRAAQDALALERNKYLQTLVSIGDGVMVVDKSGNIEILNTVAQKLTGCTFGKAVGRHYKEVFVLSHEQDGHTISDPIQDALLTDSVQELGNHAVLTSRNGVRYYLEDSAAPIKDDSGNTVGVVLVFRDVTDKKAQRKHIEYLSYHDSLTGLYNRRFFEEEMDRLDNKNLPVAVIMGDVNGLKLTNDVFGHAFGDMLLKKVAAVLRKTCPKESTIARWGGDEFVLLLPGMGVEKTERLIDRIKQSFAKEHIKAIKGSISMGFDIKQHSAQDIIKILRNAEEKMYHSKTLERDKAIYSAVDSIMATLHETSPAEKDHSQRVSELCQELGRALNLGEDDILRLKQVGYLHDIGKIVLDPKIINKQDSLSTEEWREVKRHSSAGFRILNSFDRTLDLAEAVLCHHEQWDGNGYPKGIKGEEIPLLARILSITESYERMTSPARTVPKSPAQVLKEIKTYAGNRYDPQIAKVFIDMITAKTQSEQ